MPRSRSSMALALMSAAVLAFAVPAGATAIPEKPHLSDDAGDANFLNPQGLGGIIGDENQPTPVDIASADLLALHLSTAFDEVTETGEDGVETVTRVPTGLQLSIKTSAPASPSFGPSVLLRMPGSVSGCKVFMQITVRGPGSPPGDLERPSLRLLDDTCPGGARTLNLAEDDLVIDGDVMTATYPFDKVNNWAAPGFLAEDKLISSTTTAHVRTLTGGVTAAAIDEAPGRYSFRIGSDLPTAP